MASTGNLKVRVVSDGVYTGTTVYIGDAVLTNVVAVSWKIKAGGLATLLIEVEDAEVQVVPRPDG